MLRGRLPSSRSGSRDALGGSLAGTRRRSPASSCRKVVRQKHRPNNRSSTMLVRLYALLERTFSDSPSARIVRDVARGVYHRCRRGCGLGSAGVGGRNAECVSSRREKENGGMVAGCGKWVLVHRPLSLVVRCLLVPFSNFWDGNLEYFRIIQPLF